MSMNYFNYKKYLEKQQVFHQMYVKENEFVQLLKSKLTLKGHASLFRNRINVALKKHGFKDNELGVINALLLGQRKEIDTDLLDDYANAGAIHILAVSGLHVGIILLILNFLLKPMERLKYGKTIKLFCVVFLLWSFAFVAGLSASVVRAVSMFTAVAIGWQVNRPSNIYNTLVISMFILLLMHPFFLFDVGFQMSYLAVFSIVWLQPLFYRIWSPRFKLVDYFWKLLTVSFAAQLGVLPLSIFYFHQFPGLFFLSNLLIIPILGVVLIGGILTIMLSLIDLLPQFVADIYVEIIKLMNTVIQQQKSCLSLHHIQDKPNLLGYPQKPSRRPPHCRDHPQPDHTHNHKYHIYTSSIVSPFLLVFNNHHLSQRLVPA